MRIAITVALVLGVVNMALIIQLSRAILIIGEFLETMP